MPASSFPTTHAVIADGIQARAFPAAVVEVGRADGVVWREALGRLTYEDAAPPCALDTIFDLASLTKVIATTSLAMRAVAAGRIALEQPVTDWLPGWRGGLRTFATVRHLLDHSSGLPAHARLWECATGRAAIERAILDLPLTHAPGARAIYSDPGFMLLGFLLEACGGRSLETEFASLPIFSETSLFYRPAAPWRDRIAPTEEDPWRGRLLRGEVHDENASALDGIAGHAGLFGTAGAVGTFARAVLTTFAERTWLGAPADMATFASASAVAFSSRALGWDTMRPTSSCGSRLSPSAIGHTGFTGTSVWIDPRQDLYVVFLTNRVHPTRAHNALVTLRPRLHDAVVDDLSRM